MVAVEPVGLERGVVGPALVRGVVERDLVARLNRSPTIRRPEIKF